ncbi:hypothetical protein [Rhodospirillum sp. A1_3_36]|uniref:hypothetical protein n=1 Tax=Rhodospirillum sp. A1_3_36 TaxID=3391666 RepID=UPI0039A5733E
MTFPVARQTGSARSGGSPFPPNRAVVALVLLAGGLTAILGTVLDAALRGNEDRGVTAQVVADLGLTDLALFTEARYTRNPSLADLHTPFQDHPLALDHFPSGSLIGPPTPWGQASLTKGEASASGEASE